jgi:hypothetical protein
MGGPTAWRIHRFLWSRLVKRANAELTAGTRVRTVR